MWSALALVLAVPPVFGSAETETGTSTLNGTKQRTGDAVLPDAAVAPSRARNSCGVRRSCTVSGARGATVALVNPSRATWGSARQMQMRVGLDFVNESSLRTVLVNCNEKSA